MKFFKFLHIYMEEEIQLKLTPISIILGGFGGGLVALFLGKFNERVLSEMSLSISHWISEFNKLYKTGSKT